MSKFKLGVGDWVQYRQLPEVQELDLHFAGQKFPSEPYWERMDQIYAYVLNTLKAAYQGGRVKHLLITHGASTSHPGTTTSRSQVRKLMRSKDATPYIVRKDCIQHGSVFVAAIKSKSTIT